MNELINGASPEADHRQALEAALQAFSVLSDIRWHAPILTLFAVQSHLISEDVVRLPLYLNPTDSDLLHVRKICTSMFHASKICVQALSQTGLVQKFLDHVSLGALVMDLSSAEEGVAHFVRHYARSRSVPGNHIQVAGTSQAIYGDTLLILSEEISTVIGSSGLVMDLMKAANAPCPSAEGMKAVESGLSRFAGDIKLDEKSSTLPAQPAVEAILRYGFELLERLARSADAQHPQGGYLTAVHDAWWEVESRISISPSRRSKRTQLCRHILEFIEDPANRLGKKGYREDALVQFLRSSDPEVFGNIDQTAFGKELFRLGIGTVGRDVFRGGEGESPRIWRSCVAFSETDKKKMKEVACDEL